jgi:hypothetical protein
MLIESNCIKTALNTAGLTLQADTGESFLVKGIYVGTVTTAGYLTIKVDNYTVASYRVAGKRGNELGGVKKMQFGINLMRYLVDRGLPFAIPVAEGQKLTLPVLDGVGYMMVNYDRYSAGDIKATMPNGTASKKYGFIQYLDSSGVLTASGDLMLDTSLSPAEFPAFPANEVVPSKMSISILGIEGCPFADFASANNGFYTKYLKLIRDRQVLFDEDRNGFLFWGNPATTGANDYSYAVSLIGSVGEQQIGDWCYKVQPPFMFDPPLKFNSGDELLVYLSIIKIGTHTMPADLPDIGLILQVDRE